MPRRSSFTFFFSYARDDGVSDFRLSKFFESLREEVRARTGLKPQEIAFRDTTNIDIGDEWSDEIKAGLQTSKVFVCLTSPTYINSDYCGREFLVFARRVNLYRETHPREPMPNAILPVVWVPLKTRAPEVLKSRQMDEQGVPPEYRTEGLRYLMRLKGKRDKYEAFLAHFADRLVEAAQTTLPPLRSFPSLNDVSSAFKTQLEPRGAAPPPTGAPLVEFSAGPYSTRFVFVVARPDELEGARMNLGGYHDQGGWFWRPFLPTENDAVGLIAQQVVSEMGGRFNELAFDADIVDRIAQAEKRNELIVVVVDAWTINVERYAALLRRYDQNSPQNSAVVVPWNDQDPETVRYSRKLRKRLGATLKSNTASLRFKLGASSSEDLREDLRSLLTDMQLNILGSASPEEPMATSSNQLLPVLPVPTEPI